MVVVAAVVAEVVAPFASLTPMASLALLAALVLFAPRQSAGATFALGDGPSVAWCHTVQGEGGGASLPCLSYIVHGVGGAGEAVVRTGTHDLEALAEAAGIRGADSIGRAAGARVLLIARGLALLSFLTSAERRSCAHGVSDDTTAALLALPGSGCGRVPATFAVVVLSRDGASPGASSQTTQNFVSMELGESRPCSAARVVAMSGPVSSWSMLLRHLSCCPRRRLISPRFLRSLRHDRHGPRAVPLMGHAGQAAPSLHPAGLAPPSRNHSGSFCSRCLPWRRSTPRSPCARRWCATAITVASAAS